MDLQVQANLEFGETADAQGMSDSGYGDEGGMVGLANDLLGSIEEPFGSQTSEKTHVKCFEGATKGWELGSFLLCLTLSMAATDEFLGLELIKVLPLSFCTAKELRGLAKLLPSVLKWQYYIISTTHPTKQPLHFYWHNPLDCIELLFSHPLFANEINVTPQHGMTLLGIILSSDKTNITNMTGGCVAHPLLISLANIKMVAQNKASSNAFLLTALLPIAEFLHLVKWMQSVLKAHLVHQCLDILLELLKQAACIRWMMSDPLGKLRYCFTPLASYIVNTPKACMPTCVQGKTSPVTMAMYENFGDAF
ncbi:hypothetical protein EDD22DRAFT_845149 [Suillus occidentalis]|nr:hypothetical protein EDD22DRAFT_845149 [Suillus occidentalis]